MPLTFPRDMPADGVDSQSFDLKRVDHISPETGGRVGAVTAGLPLWVTTLNIANADSDETDIWSAWLDAQRGPQRLFYGRDLTRPYPRDYPAGFTGLVRAGTSTPFPGTASTWSLNAARDELTLTGLPAGFWLRPRDYVGFSWSTAGASRRALVRAVEAKQAFSPGTLTIAVEPPVPSLVPSEATATLNNPTCLMRLVPGESSIGARDVLHTAGGVISAVQELLP